MNSLKLKIKEMPYLISKVFGLIYIAFVLESCGGGSPSYYETVPCIVYGKVTDADTQEPIEGIRVNTQLGYGGNDHTDSLGNYTMFAIQGEVIDIVVRDIDNDVNGAWLDTAIVLNTLNMSKIKLDVKMRKKL
jgi:hypothetical protein